MIQRKLRKPQQSYDPRDPGDSGKEEVPFGRKNPRAGAWWVGVSTIRNCHQLSFVILSLLLTVTDAEFDGHTYILCFHQVGGSSSVVPAALWARWQHCCILCRPADWTSATQPVHCQQRRGSKERSHKSFWCLNREWLELRYCHGNQLWHVLHVLIIILLLWPMTHFKCPMNTLVCSLCLYFVLSWELRAGVWSAPTVCAAASFYGHVEHGAEHQTLTALLQLSCHTAHGMDWFVFFVCVIISQSCCINAVLKWTKSVI